MSSRPLEITVEDLKASLDGGEEMVVLDVREPWELEMARLDGSLDIPMNEIPDRLDEVPGDRPVAVLCRSGARSMKVTQYLRANGFADVSNIGGGILAWANAYDPSMTRY